MSRLVSDRFHETHRIGRMELKPTDLILRRRTDLGFTRDRHIKFASRLQPTCEAPSRRPHPEELGALLGAPSVSKDGRWLDLACGRPSRRAQARSSGRG